MGRLQLSLRQQTRNSQLLLSCACAFAVHSFFFSSAALGCDRALRIRNHSLGNARRSGLARHLASVAWTTAQRLRDFFSLVFDA